MRVDAFDFELPESAIALRPAVPRESARLLEVLSAGDLLNHSVGDLPELLQSGDVLVLNNTRVLRAALTAIRPARAVGGGGDVSVALNLHKQISQDTWRAFARPAKRLRIGDILSVSEVLRGEIIDKSDGGDITLKFNLAGNYLAQAIEKEGKPPLPPYIARKRKTDVRDVNDYQTIYAKDTGSVAAPTAGLHFTDQLFDALRERGVQIVQVTLHVGAGTFLPVKSDNTENHTMHSEWFTIDTETADKLNRAKINGRRIIAVGTTALRALESAAVEGRIAAVSKETDIFITPGYKFQIIDGLMTNFHLPRSTLFMLVSALAGLEVMQAAYAHAIKKGYRFYSYGDTSLIWKAV